jgi:hypothetical protein
MNSIKELVEGFVKWNANYIVVAWNELYETDTFARAIAMFCDSTDARKYVELLVREQKKNHKVHHEDVNDWRFRIIKGV